MRIILSYLQVQNGLQVKLELGVSKIVASSLLSYPSESLPKCLGRDGAPCQWPSDPTGGAMRHTQCHGLHTTHRTKNKISIAFCGRTVVRPRQYSRSESMYQGPDSRMSTKRSQLRIQVIIIVAP